MLYYIIQRGVSVIYPIFIYINGVDKVLETPILCGGGEKKQICRFVTDARQFKTGYSSRDFPDVRSDVPPPSLHAEVSPTRTLSPCALCIVVNMWVFAVYDYNSLSVTTELYEYCSIVDFEIQPLAPVNHQRKQKKTKKVYIFFVVVVIVVT